MPGLVPAPVVNALAAEAPPLAPGVRLRAAWASARARNALRRPGVIGAVGTVVLVAALAALVFVPREAMRAARNAAPRPGEKADTAEMAARAAAERVAYQRADSAVIAKRQAGERAVALAAARVRAAAAAAAALRAGFGSRDSVLAAVAELDRLLARAQTSPLPSSYRALADARAVRGDPRVRAAIDSLDEVEREREAFGVVGGVDPVYVSLTNRVTQLGRVVEGIADRRRAALRGQLEAATPAGGAGAAGVTPGGAAGGAPGAGVAAETSTGAAAGGAADAPGAGAPPQAQGGAAAGGVPNQNVVSGADSTPSGAPAVASGAVGARPLIQVDTLVESARRDTARVRLSQVEAALAAARTRNQAVDRRVAAARARADVEAPPVAVLLAAVTLAVAVGYAAALVGELRRPRLADADEAERVTRTRVLAVVRPDADVHPERDRRQTDESIPALVDASVESYRLLYLGLSATGAAVSRVGVTADEPSVAAAVALNVAAAAAEDGRSTLVVDGDVRHAVASAALGVRDRLGLADAFGAGLPVADLVVPVTVGRGAAVDVIPAGMPARQRTGQRSAAAALATSADATGEDKRAELGRVARRYDVTVTAVPPVPAGVAAPSPDDPVTPDGVAREVLAREVIVCARAGHTPLAGLTREIARLNALGANVRGLVVWDDELPAEA